MVKYDGGGQRYNGTVERTFLRFTKLASKWGKGGK